MSNFEIGQIVPKFILSDRNGYAIAKAIEVCLKIFDDKCREGIAMVQDVDSMPDWRLNDLAWELGLEWYNSDTDTEGKRTQIRNAYNVFGSIGTKKAILDAISGIFGEGYIKEWYEYNGRPYHYTIYVTDESAVDSKNEEFMKIVNFLQNARSVIDTVFYSGMNGKTVIYTAAAAVREAYLSSRAIAHIDNHIDMILDHGILDEARIS